MVRVYAYIATVIIFAPPPALTNQNTTFPCNIPGWATGDAIPFSITSTYTNLTTCIELCRVTNGACRSFSYLSGCGPGQDEIYDGGEHGSDCSWANTCELYAASIKPYLQVDAGSPVRWFDMACFDS
ncbi:hypothetical protein KEM54_002908, partial [Ascosphaera aggregata]